MIPSHPLRTSTKAGTTGSFSRVRCSCSSSADMLTKETTEKTSTEADVSRLMSVALRLAMVWCVRW